MSLLASAACAALAVSLLFRAGSNAPRAAAGPRARVSSETQHPATSEESSRRPLGTDAPRPASFEAVAFPPEPERVALIRPVPVAVRIARDAGLETSPLELVLLRNASSEDSTVAPDPPPSLVRHPIAPCLSDASIPLEEGDWLVLLGTGVAQRILRIEGVHVVSGRVELAAEPAPILTGCVLDLDEGTPVAGARVAWERTPSPADLPAALCRLLASAPEPRGRTLPDGTFRLQLPADVTGTLSCSAEGYATAECVEVVADGRPLSIALVPSIAAAGRVVDEGGLPIRGAEVAAGRLGAIPVEETVVARTDSSGRFASAALPRARVALIARADGHAPARIELDLRAAAPPEFVLVLARESLLSGIVLDEDDHPVAGARILVASLSDHLVVGSVEAGADGVFAMPWVRENGSYHLEIEAEGFDPADVGPLAPAQEPLRIRLLERGRLALCVEDPEDGAPPAFRVARAPEVEAEVHDEFWWSGAEWTEVAAGDGRCELSGLRRLPHRIFVAADGFVPRILRATPTPPRTAPVELVVRLERGRRLSGTLLDDAGAPLPGADLRLAARASFGSRRPVPAAEPVVTDAAGRFELLVSPGSPFDLVASRVGFAPVLFRQLDPSAAAVSLRWPRTGTIHGRVHASDATLFGSICLRAEEDDGGAFAERRPRPDGSFAFEHMPCGPARVRLIDEWASTHWHTFAVRERQVDVPPESAVDLDFDLRPSIAVEGRLVLPRELEASRFEVVAVRSGHGSHADRISSTVELSGRFVLCGLAPGRWTVAAVARSAGLLALVRAEIEVSADETPALLELSVPLPASRVEAVAAESGRPLARAWVELGPADGALLARVEADERGRVEIAAPALLGAERCRVRAPGYAPADLTLGGGPATARRVELEREARLEIELAPADIALLRDARVGLEVRSTAISWRPAAPSLSLSELPAGHLRLRVESPDRAAVWSGRLAAGQTRSLRLALAPSGAIAVRVLGARGAALPHRTVALLPGSGAGEPFETRTDADGRAREHLPAGAWTVACGAAAAAVEVPPGGAVEVELRVE